MFVDHGLLGALSADPLAAYPALAALLLASVAIASGLLRGDVLALARPAPVAWGIAAVGATWLLQGAATGLPVAWSDTVAAAALAPIAIIAVAYGPTPALVTLALVHAWVGLPPYPSPAVGPVGGLFSGLELALLGWLAIAPSPRRYPLLAGLYLLLAHAFTWATAGLAWLVVTHGDLSLAAATDTHGMRFGAVAATATVLALVPPSWWRRAFPGSALALPSREHGPARTPAPVSTTPPATPATPAEPGAPGAPAATTDEARDSGRMTGVWDGADLRPWTRARTRHPDGAAEAPSAPAAPERFERPPRRRGDASRP